MDSDSSESDESQDNQNNQNFLFNTRQTKEVEKCVSEVLKLIQKALIKDTKCKKKHIKPIKKETKKTKLKKNEVADQIQRLCKAIKDISSTLADPVANVLASLRTCEVVPGPSGIKIVKTPVKLKHSTDNIVPGSSRDSNHHYETTTSVTSQSNTELVVFGNNRTYALEPKTLEICGIGDHGSHGNGIKTGPGIPITCVESNPGPSRSYLESRSPESLRRMGVTCTSKSPRNVAESITLRQDITLPPEMSKTIPKKMLASSKGAAVPAPKMSDNHIKETSNSHVEIHLGAAGNPPKALLEIIKKLAVVSSLEKILRVFRSRSAIEISKVSDRCSDAAVPEILRTNAVPGTTICPTQTAPEPSRNCAEIVVTEISKSFTKSVNESSKTHHKTDEICIEANLGSPETRTEAANGLSRSLSKTKKSESSIKTMEEEVAQAPARSFDAVVVNTSRNNKTAASEILCDSTNTIVGTTKSPTQTTPEASRNCTETSDSFTKSVKESSKADHKTNGTCIEATHGTPETGMEAANGLSRSLFKTHNPESSIKNMEKEVAQAPARSFDAVVVNTSRNKKTVLPEISCDSTKTMPGTTKSPTQTAPEPSRNCTEWNHGTAGTAVVIPGIPETLAEAGTVPLRRPSETQDPESSRRNTKAEVPEITSRLDVAESVNSMHTKTIIPDTSSIPADAIPGTSKSDSNVAASRTIRNKTAAMSPAMSRSDDTADNMPHKENNNSKYSTKTTVNVTEKDEINNNCTEKRKIEANLKTNHTTTNNHDPKRAKNDHKCTLCGKVLTYEDFAKHYQEQHGMHHEIKHNNKNYEHKIHDLNKRLQNPTDKTKPNNEQKDKILTICKKRTAAAPNEGTEQTVAKSAVVNGDREVEEPAQKKKKTATRSDSTPHETVKETNATTVKSETKHNTELDDFVIDLTDDIALGESKSPTHVTVKNLSLKPVGDDQILSDHQFVDLSDDTSLYEIHNEEDTKSAEALLLENVKQEQAANHHDVEVMSKILPTISNNKESADKKYHITKNQSTNETKPKLPHHESLQKRNYCIAFVPETSRRATETVSPLLIISNNNTSGNLSSASPGTDKNLKVTKSGTPNNPTKINASDNTASHTALGFGTVGNRTGLSTGTSIPPIETVESSKGKSKKPAINQHLTQTKPRTAQLNFSKRRNGKPHRKSPYEKPNKALSKTNINSTDTIVTQISHSAPKVAMINATTTRVTQKTNEPISVEKNTSKETNTNQLKTDNASTDTIHISDSKTTGLSKQQTNKTIPKSTEKHTLNTKNKNDSKMDFYPGLAIKTVNAPKENLTNTTSVSVSLPNSTTITPPVQATQKAIKTSALNCTKPTGVPHSMPLPPTPSTNRIATSNSVKPPIQKKSALEKFYSIMDNLPPGPTPNIASQKLNSETQKSNTHVSSSASVSPLSLQNDPVHPVNKPQHLTGYLAWIQVNQPSNQQRRPASSTSQFCNTSQNVTTNINPTPSISVQSTTKQHSNTLARTNKSDFQTTTNTRRKSVPAELHGKNTNTSVDIQSPQTKWYPPILLSTIGDLNTSSSNAASRHPNRRASVNSNNTQHTFRWHTPVEPENERTETSTNVSQSVTLNNLSLSFSNPVESRHQSNPRTAINRRPNHQRADARQQSSNSEVGWQNRLNIRHPSILLQDQGLRLPQADRTWHTPVKRQY